MKPQIIELEDGSKWELATNHIRPDSNSNLVLFRFTRLPPENPMPELKEWDIVCARFITGPFREIDKYGYLWGYSGASGEVITEMAHINEIKKIYRDGSLIWSKEGKV